MEQTLNLDNGSITITTTGYKQGEATAETAFTGTYRITQSSSRTSNTITVSSGVTATIILSGVNIRATNPFDAKLAKEVTLILRGENTIESIGGGPAVSCPVKEGTKLTIKKDDVQGGSLTANGYRPYSSLGSAGIGFNANGQLIKGSIIIESGTITATGGSSSAGIGLYTMFGNQKGGTIHIKGGTITAKGGSNAAGIGSSEFGGNTTILIEGGTIEATGGNNGGAGIGAGYGSNVYSGTTTIRINGGTITAKGGSNAAGIGGGSDKGGKITITGGEITATGGTKAADIGAGNEGEGYAISISGGVINAQNAGIGNYSVAADKTPSTFLTGDAGKAIIFATSISDQSNKGLWSGLIFENNEGEIYGNNDYHVNQDVTIPEGHTLIIKEGKSLSIADGKTLTNNGKIVNRGTTGFEVSGNDVISQYKLTAEMITVAKAVYNGSSLEPTVTVRRTPEPGVVESEKYTVTYENNINAGDEAGTVTIRMNDPGFEVDALFGEATKTFTIDKAKPEITLTLSGESGLVYDGAEKDVATVSVSGVNHEPLHAATLSYQKKTGNGTWVTLQEGNKPTDAGTYQAVATFAETGNYKQWTENSDEFSITAKALTDAMVSLSSASFTYTGTDQKPTVTVADGDLITANDYAISYSPEACTNAGTYTVTVTGQGNYTGEVSNDYTIDKYTPTISFTLPAGSDLVYNGTAKEATASVSGVVGESETLSATLSYQKQTGEDTWGALSSAPKDVGTYKVTAKYAGNNNYDAKEDSEVFTITAKNLTANMVSLSGTPFTYNGTDQKPNVTVTDGGLITANDYAISYSSEACTNAGTYTVTVTGQGNYTGEVSNNYTIDKYTPTITLNVPAVSDLVYNGTAKEATASVSGVVGESETLSATLSYQKQTGEDTWGALSSAPKDVGTYKVTAKYAGNNNYDAKEDSQVFTITAKELTGAIVSLSPTSFTYNGSEQKPDVTVKDGTTDLVKNTDYTLTWPTGCTNAGTYTVTITGKGNYTSVISQNYTIDKYTPTITLDVPTEAALVYDGTEKVATANVAGVAGETAILTASLSYQKKNGDAWVDLSGDEKPKDAGSYQVTAKYAGNDNYKEEEDSKTFTIAAKNLTADMVSLSPTSFTYTGTDQKPTVTVKDGTTDLTENTDYNLTLSEGRINAGTYTVTVTGKGNYKETVDKTFTITQATNSWTSALAITGWTYGESANNPSATAAFGEPSFSYAAAENGEYTATVPTTAGTWWVKASVDATDNYEALESNISFTIAKAIPTITLDVPTEAALVYDGTEKVATANVAGVAGETAILTASLSYQKKNGDAWVDLSGDEKPKDAGSYQVTAKYAGNDNYKEEEGSKAFTITAKELTADMVSLSPTSFTYNGSEQKPTVTVAYGNLITANDYAISYLPEGCTNAGTYTVKVTGKGNYQGTVNKTFTITKATNRWNSALAIEGWTYGVSAKSPSATAAFGTPTFSYAAAEDGTYSATAPTTAGTWWVKASVAATGDYAALESKTSFSITPADAGLSFAQSSLTMTQGNAVPANALTNPHTCAVTYTSSEPTVATVDATTGVVTVVGVGTTTITATTAGNYTGTASYTLNVNRSVPPYIPPTSDPEPDPDPDPIYYTVTIPTEVTGAIIHGGGTHEVEEYTYCSFRIELDPNGNGEYPTVTKGYWWDTLTPDGQGNYSVYVTGNTQITIGEVPTNSYDYYQVTLPTDSVAEADDQYWSGDYIEVIGATPLRAAEVESIGYQVPFGATVTLRPIETERRKFLMWEDGSSRKERTLTLRADQEIKALWKRISPTGIEAIADGSVIRGERGQLYIEVPEPCDVTLYTYGGVPVRVARLAAGANRLANLNAGLYLVKIGAAPAVPVRVR